jgi:hypothetical protein
LKAKEAPGTPAGVSLIVPAKINLIASNLSNFVARLRIAIA